MANASRMKKVNNQLKTNPSRAKLKTLAGCHEGLHLQQALIQDVSDGRRPARPAPEWPTIPRLTFNGGSDRNEPNPQGT